MADDPLTDRSNQRQRRKHCLSGAQRVYKRRNPFTVAECLFVNFPHSLVIFGPFLPDHQLNTSALKVIALSHDARLVCNDRHATRLTQVPILVSQAL